MSDRELYEEGLLMDLEKAKARIEKLIAERDQAWKRAAHAEEMWGKAEVKMAKAVEDAEKYQHAFAAQSRKLQAVLHIEGVRTTLAEIKSGIATTPYGLEGESQ